MKQLCLQWTLWVAVLTSPLLGETIVFQNDLNGYYEQYDAMMQSGTWGAAGYTETGSLNYGLGAMFFEQVSETSRSANLLKFDLEGLLPEGATIIRATLTLALRTAPSPTPSNTIQLAAFRSNKPWAPESTFWTSWGNGGNITGYCNFNSTDGIASIPPTAGALTKYSMDLTVSMVQQWIDYPWLNYGVLLRQVEYGTHQFYIFGREVQGTSLASLAPKLTVEYTAPTVANRLTRGHRTLLKKGLQIVAMMFPNYYDANVPFSMTRFHESNCTTLDMVDPYMRPQWIQDDPNALWTRQSTWSDIQSCEKPYIKNLVSLKYGDEQDITSQTELDVAKTKFNSIKAKYPSVINMTCQEGGQFTYSELRNYISYCQPDMLMFDTYPFYGYNAVGGRPPHIYSHLGKYRQLGLEGLDGTGAQPIPCALYTQVFTSNTSPWNNHRVSQSEMCLNTFAAWMYGLKYIDLFIYVNQAGNTTLQSLLFNGDGDLNPTSEFYQIAEINRQSRNLGPALTRLISTDVRCIPGQVSSSTNNSIPDFANGWSDPNRPASTLFTGIDNIVNPGMCNSGLRGDIFVGFFKPLHESFDGPNYSNEAYFMVLNGLSDYTGSAVQTHQRMRLRFAASVTQLQRLSRNTGMVETLPLTVDGTTKYYELELDGGTADLFKIDTGAPFVGVVKIALNAGDANGDGMVDVGDLGILAANYGGSGKSWSQGDFNGDGAVDVGDLGILAANYGVGTAEVNYQSDYANIFGMITGEETSTSDDTEEIDSGLCNGLGLPLVAGLSLMGLMLVKSDWLK